MSAKIKVIEAPHEVWWDTTHEGTFEVDGTDYEFRYNENSNGTDMYIFIEGVGWSNDPGEEYEEVFDVLYEMLSSYGMDDFEQGEEFEYEQ